MSSCRLLRPVIITTGTSDQIRVTYNAVPATIVLAAGTYYLEGDDSADDLLKLVSDAVAAQFTLTCTFDIIGVGATDTTKAEGRLKFDHSGTGNVMTFDGNHAAWTLGGAGKTGVLGFPDSAQSAGITGGTPVYTDGPAWGTWYPQVAPRDPGPEEGRYTESVDIEGTPETDGKSWGYYDEQILEWGGHIHIALMKRSASEDTASQTVARLGTTPTWASWEQFCKDMQAARDAADSTDRYRTYAPSLTSTPTGPFFWPARFPGWDRPMKAGRRVTPSTYALTIEGRAAQ